MKNWAYRCAMVVAWVMAVPCMAGTANGGQPANPVQLWAGGPYWADRNIGAEEPWDSGHYFRWGDTVGFKRENGAWVAVDGSVTGFAFAETNTPTWDKDPAILERDGWITEEGVLAPEHDAAQVQWGSGWRMPTEQELRDLCYHKCDWTWTTTNGIQGYVVSGRGNHASASIFLPAAGCGRGTALYFAGAYGSWWSAVPNSGYYGSWGLHFNSDSRNADGSPGRERGRSIRPVRDQEPVPE